MSFMDISIYKGGEKEGNLNINWFFGGNEVSSFPGYGFLTSFTGLKGGLMKKFLTVLGVIFLLTAGLANAQEQTGELFGTVTDEQKAPLPGVTVEAQGPALIGTRTSVSDDMGRFRLLRLPPGTYMVTFTLPGFATLHREGILVRLGATYYLNVNMTPATLEEEITVIGESPVVDIRKSSSTMEISKEMFSKLPKGRNFASVVTVASGVNDESELGGISFDGASSSENMYFVDGVDTTRMYDGTSGQNIMFDFVEEVQVKSAGYEAQYGGSMGGVINVVTRSGGNEFHGEVLVYYDGSSLNGEPRPSLRVAPYDDTKFEYISYPEDSWNRYEIGLALGGYLVKDKVWFFGSYIPRFEITVRDAIFLTDRTADSQFTQSEQWHHGSFKLTAQPTGAFRVSLSWNTDANRWRGSLPGLSGTSPVDYGYASAGYNYPGWTAAVRSDYVVSDNLFFSAYGGMFHINSENIIGPPSERYYFYRSNADVAIAQAGTVRPMYWYNYPSGDRYQLTKNTRNKYTAALDGTYYADLGGEHMFKVGAQFVRITQDVFDAAPYDSWYFWWGEDYHSPSGTIGTTYGYMAAYDPLGTVAAIQSDRFAIYAQDSWTIGNKLTLNFGVRAEKEDIPSFVDPEADIISEHPEFLEPPIAFDFFDKLAPRVGFAYDVFGDASLKVFGSFGIYYDVMKLDMAEGSYGGFKWLAHYYDIPQFVAENWQSLGERDHPDTSLPYFESLDWRIPSYDTTQPSEGAQAMKPYSKMEFTGGVQYRLAQDVSFTARFLHNRVLWAIEDIGVQTPAGEKYYNGNPGSDWINDIYAEQAALDPQNLVPVGVTCPKGQREYYSLDVGFDKRFSNNWMAGLHYTWSRLWGNFAGLASSEEHGRKDPNVERYFDAWFLHYTSDAFSGGKGTESNGLLVTDRPHQWKLYGAYSFDFGLTIGTNAFAMVGTPFTTEWELNRADGYYPEGRFNPVASNDDKPLRTPFLWRIDLYAEYNIRIGERQTFQINLNLNNVSNNRIAQRYYNVWNFDNVYMDNDDIVAGFDYLEESLAQNISQDPRYLKEYAFQSTITARIGLKFMF